MTPTSKVTLAQFKASRSGHFSKIDTLGSFDFYTMCISLEALELGHVSQMQSISASVRATSRRLTEADYSGLSKTLPLAVHEYTHFIDATSTVWGADLLERTASAYTSAVPDETQFIRAKRHQDYLKGIRLPAYYSLVSDCLDQSKPWRCIPSIGKVFALDGNVSARPVLFGRFFNANGQDLVRSPISMISLLEASAMAQELFCTMNLLSNSEEFKFVESKILSDKTLRFIYDKDLTEYSVCVHLIANHLKCSDILQAFGVCSLVVRAALNFPSDHFQKITLGSVSSVLGIAPDHAFVQAVFQGIQCGDRGVLYYLLCEALPSGSHENHAKAREGLSSAMQQLQIDEVEASASALEEVYTLSRRTFEGEGAALSVLRSTCLENFTASTEGKLAVELPWERLHLPPVILGDCETTRLLGRSDGPLARKEFFEECFNELHEGQKWVDRFSEACF